MSSTDQGATADLRPLRVFISYSHKDDDLREKLVTALSQLQRDGVIERWDDREITGGTEWAGKIDEHLNTADIILLLVSPDFLASPYCYDVEMTRALERHNSREARVVPIILRPCDWKHSPFAKLNALPKDGKPAIDWPTLDHAFLNIAQGLRKTAREISDQGETAAQGKRNSVQTHLPRRGTSLLFAAVGLALLAAGLWLWHVRHQRSQLTQNYIAQGYDRLDVGRYEEARNPFTEAVRIDPTNVRAKLGTEIVDLAASKADRVAFQQRLNEMLKQWPNESHLRVLHGDSLLVQEHPQDAALEYRKAIELNPHLAEAYFRLGVLFDKEGEEGHAQKMYAKAVEISPFSAQYRDNLADAYFKHGEYGKAIAEYGHLDRFPLAALESGKINRLLGRLDEAREQELTAVRWLNDASVTRLPENQLPWYFTHENEGVMIVSPNEKLCYAHFELSATLYLGGDLNQSTVHAQEAQQACGFRSSHVKAAVRWDLERVIGERDDLKTRATKYSAEFLHE